MCLEPKFQFASAMGAGADVRQGQLGGTPIAKLRIANSRMELDDCYTDIIKNNYSEHNNGLL